MNPVAVVVGTMHMDFVIYVDQLPKLGETVLGHKFETFPGGKGANQAVALARLGAEVYMVSRVGEDFVGKELLENAKRNNVKTDYVVVDSEEKSGVAFIIVDKEGENVIAVAPGVDNRICIEDLNRAEPAFSKASVVLAQLEIPVETALEAMKRGKEKGALTILNVAPVKKLPLDQLKYVDILVLNARELEALVKIATGETLNYIEASRRILEQGVSTVIVTRGKEGAEIITKEYSKLIPTFKVKVVDTVGAGDAFCGALAYALSRKAELEDAVRFANMVAALKVTKKGAQTGLPYLSEVRKFAEEQGVAFKFI
ncbi:MAG: ribokinase [Thermoprotei archaeon]|nr:MAG: ribokinase [Thermoprotei archaeon]